MSVPNITPMTNKRTALDYALAYLNIGWWVLPLAKGTKQPAHWLIKNGVHGASNDPDVVRDWFTRGPDCGIGIAMLQSGLVGIDIDPRNGGFDTMATLEATNGALVSDVLAMTGGGGEHRVFYSSLVTGLPGKLGPGVDVKADGYLCVEPSIHPNGCQYVWEGSSDPLEGCVPSSLPGWVRDLARSQTIIGPVIAQAVRFIDDKQIEDLRAALAALSADDYHTWVNYGNALVQLGHAGFLLWDQWSQKSDKYDPRAVTAKWRSFKPGSYQLESIFFSAQGIGWVNPASVAVLDSPVPVETVRIAKPQVFQSLPINLLSPPGVLGLVTDWVNATARKPQPIFAVQTAIAFASTVLGRRFVTDQRNWSSLYLLNIGHSASGKEHAKKAVEDLLDACGMGNLIGPASYTSNSGLLSALHDQPSHITVIDEFGKELEQASVKGNARAQGTMKLLIEVWGRCDGTLRPQGYSTFGMNSSEKKDITDRVVRNPALTLLGMTTPDSFFDTIGSAAARDGFLNRFLIVESDVGPQVSRMVKQISVPEDVIAWAQAMQATSTSLVDPTSSASTTWVPVPVEVAISNEAKNLFILFEAECIDKMKASADTGLMEMFGRTNEIAMKLAMVVACTDHMIAPVVLQEPHAAWAIQYVRFHSQRTFDRLLTSVHDSEFSAVKQQVMKCLTKAGARGLTPAQLEKVSRKFEGLPKRSQVELLNSLAFVHRAKNVLIPPPSGRGKARDAWVALDGTEESTDGDNGDKNSPIPACDVDGEKND